MKCSGIEKTQIIIQTQERVIELLKIHKEGPIRERPYIETLIRINDQVHRTLTGKTALEGKPLLL